MGVKGAMPPKCLERMVILSFERHFSKQNSVIRLKSNILSPPIFCPPKILDWLRHCGICKTSLLHRSDDYIGFTPSCPPHIYNKIAPMAVTSQALKHDVITYTPYEGLNQCILIFFGFVDPNHHLLHSHSHHCECECMSHATITT